MSKAKYIRTVNDKIIVFSEVFQHFEFTKFKPKSAGFINFKTHKLSDGSSQCECVCYGESVTLGLKSDPEDTRLAQMQILDHY